MKPHPHPTGPQIRSERSIEWLLIEKSFNLLINSVNGIQIRATERDYQLTP